MDIGPEQVKEAIDEFVEMGVPKPDAVAAVNNMVNVCLAINDIEEADDDKAGKSATIKAAKYLASLRVPKYRP